MEASVLWLCTNGVEYNMHRPDSVGLWESACWLLISVAIFCFFFGRAKKKKAQLKIIILDL